jgi:AraC-like DNA-binding protein
MIWLDEGGQHCTLPLVASPPGLCEVVEHFWIQETIPKNVWRIVPDVNPHVIFSITQSRKAPAADCCVVGARSQFFDLDVTGRVLTIGARLRPGVLPLLVRDSALHFTDLSIPIEDIYGLEGTWLIEQMVESSPREALKRLAQFLSKRSGTPSPLSAGLPRGITSVSGLAHSLNTSRRSVHKRISSAVGLSPKVALRIHRMHVALYELHKGCSLADAAAGAGYSDQAHFTRETASLLGESPTVWRNRGFPFVQDNKSRCGR